MQKKENKNNEDKNFAHAVISWDSTNYLNTSGKY